MLKKDLIARVAAKRSLSHREAEAAVDLIFDAMRKALARHDTVEFRGFGRFQVRTYKGYVGKNPKTKAAMNVAPTHGVLFRTGKELYDRLNSKPVEAAAVDKEKSPLRKSPVRQTPVSQATAAP